jgi:ribosomal protein S24E
VYKEALRSLLAHEQKLNSIISDVKDEIAQLAEARKELDVAFKNGTLHGAHDARGIVRTVGRRIAQMENE